jgi:hypothetical protein
MAQGENVGKVLMHSDGKTGQLIASSDLTEEDKLCIRKAVEEMVGSVPFRTSRQCQDLLRHIVAHSLSGEEESLRERIIGVEVFGRRPDYDQATDPVVRIRAADVRNASRCITRRPAMPRVMSKSGFLRALIKPLLTLPVAARESIRLISALPH